MCVCVCIYLSAVYSISSIHIKTNKQWVLGYIIIVLIALKIE